MVTSCCYQWKVVHGISAVAYDDPPRRNETVKLIGEWQNYSPKKIGSVIVLRINWCLCRLIMRKYVPQKKWRRSFCITGSVRGILKQVRNCGPKNCFVPHLVLHAFYIGRDVFTRPRCPVDTCMITANREFSTNANLIVYKDLFIPTTIRRPPNQLYMLYYLESPYHTQHLNYPDVFNWTSTYRFVLSLNRNLFSIPIENCDSARFLSGGSKR